MYDEYQHRYSIKNACKWHIYGKVRQLSFKQEWNKKITYLVLKWQSPEKEKRKVVSEEDHKIFQPL